MDFFYFLVTGSQSWEPHYHENFFTTQGGFLWGTIGAAVIGILFALIFYFGCCNSKTSQKSATTGVWAIFLLIGGVVAYFYADMVVIGNTGTTDNASIFRSHSFYKANEDYYIQQTSQGTASPTLIQELTQTKGKIKSDLDKGGDVRFDFDITTALLAVLCFFITSIIVKRFTLGGKSIPFLKP